MQKIIKNISLILVVLVAVLFGCVEPSHDTFSPGEGQLPPITEVYEPTVIDLVAVGDNLLHSAVYNSAKTAAAGNGYDFSSVYGEVAPYIQAADLAFVNQETPLGGVALGLSSYPKFNSPQEVGEYLYSIGFNLISHANNHILDKGSQGLKNTLNFWLDKDVAVAGAALNAEMESQISLVEVKNTTVALLAYTYGTNGLFLPQGSEQSVAYIDQAKIAQKVAQAQELADLVIVSMHWGNEYQSIPTEEQRNLADFLADLGVDVVIGHHPHVVQTMEIKHRADGGETLVIYSLGNFVSAQNKANTMLGGLVKAQIIIDKEQQTKTIDHVSFVPLVTQYSKKYKDIKVIPWPNYTRELANAHGIKAYDSHFSYDYLEQLAQKIIPAEYLDLSNKMVG